MAVKIRLRRMGTNKKPFYRIVATDSRFPRDGRFIEILGFYNPKTSPKQIKIEKEKVISWLRKGAKMSQTVERLFKTYR